MLALVMTLERQWRFRVQMVGLLPPIVFSYHYFYSGHTVTREAAGASENSVFGKQTNSIVSRAYLRAGNRIVAAALP